MTSTNRYRTVMVAGFLGAILFSLGASVHAATQIPMTAVPANESARLVDADQNPVEVNSSLDIPFSLTNVPQEAKLQFNFRVDSRGTCSLNYQPTTISINKKLIGQINFKDSYRRGQKASYTVALPSGVLQIGENLIQVSMGSCMKAIDAMRLNNVTLLQ